MISNMTLIERVSIAERLFSNVNSKRILSWGLQTFKKKKKIGYFSLQGIPVYVFIEKDLTLSIFMDITPEGSKIVEYIKVKNDTSPNIVYCQHFLDRFNERSLNVSPLNINYLNVLGEVRVDNLIALQGNEVVTQNDTGFFFGEKLLSSDGHEFILFITFYDTDKQSNGLINHSREITDTLSDPIKVDKMLMKMYEKNES